MIYTLEQNYFGKENQKGFNKPTELPKNEDIKNM